MVYSQQTGAYYGRGMDREKVEDPIMGFYQALIEARIPFEMVHEGLLDAEHIDHFKTLILPNVAALSDEQCQQIRAYVERGGSLVVTHETSLYDEWGSPRSDFGLADVLGVHYGGQVQGVIKNSYLNLETDPATGKRHPLLNGLEYADRIINGGNRVVVRAAADFGHPPLTLVPSYPDLPMEEVYPRQPHTDIPEVYAREIGKSRVVYFPWDIDRIFWEILNVDHGKLLANAVEWATNAEPPVTVSGQGVIDLTVWEQENSMTVHLVNMTNPMMMRGPFRELYAIGEQRVKVRLPEGRQVRRVQLLRHGQEVPVDVRDGWVHITVPGILDNELVAIDF
jgi:hypothetical protein